MALVAGVNCVALYNTGTAGSPTWVAATNITGAEVNLSTQTADVSRRGTNKFRATMPTLSEGTVSFDLIYDTGDAFFDAIELAFRNRTTIDMWFGTGPIATDGAEGYRAAWSVTDFSESQTLEDAVRRSVTLSVSGTTPVPGLWRSNGTALSLVTE